MNQSYEELPEEIWELILNKLGSDRLPDFESLSIVNKRLLSLTDRLRHRFTVVDQTYFIHGTIYKLIYRFSNLKTLDLSKLSHRYLNTAIREIARSSAVLNLDTIDVSNHDSIPIESLKELGLSNRKRKIKVLRCANVVRLRDDDLLTIAKCYPDLEELDISYPRHKFTIAAFRDYNINDLMITDEGIEGLVSGLKNLVKINISMHNLLTDKALIDISLNCLRLEEIVFVNCTMITMRGVRFMLDNSPNLRSISMCLLSHIHGTESLFMNPVTSGRRLASLHFKDSDISDEFVNAIVEARVPLTSVSLPGCNGYTMYGISRLVHAYQSLKFLDLSRNNWLDDKAVVVLSEYLRDLVSVKLNFCHKLTSTSLFALMNNCSFLEQIEMEHTYLGKEEYSHVVVKNRNISIKSLKISRSSHLRDESLLKITSFCPKLKQLDLSSCSGISLSLSEILITCPEITDLSIRDCGGVKNIGLNTEPLKLQKLDMARSGVNDEGLVGITVRCKELVKVNLAGCLHVTTSAVKYMVKNCVKLREIDLMGCPNLHVFIVDWMVFTRPSLRNLIPPSYAVTTECQRQLLLRHGCRVCDK